MARHQRGRATAWVVGGLLGTACVVAALPSCNSDCSFDDVDVAGRDTNPDGVPYPTDRLGASPRHGTTPGDHFPNLTFQGYVDSNRDAGLQTVSLADVYDPNATRHRVLHLMAGVMWCPHCQHETDLMASLVPTLRAEGAVFIQALLNGPSRGKGPDLCDMGSWIDDHATSFTVVIDQGARRLGSVADVSAVPWNALIDTRTMEVLDVSVGTPEDFAAYVRSALNAVPP